MTIIEPPEKKESRIGLLHILLIPVVLGIFAGAFYGGTYLYNKYFAPDPMKVMDEAFGRVNEEDLVPQEGEGSIYGTDSRRYIPSGTVKKQKSGEEKSSLDMLVVTKEDAEKANDYIKSRLSSSDKEEIKTAARKASKKVQQYNFKNPEKAKSLYVMLKKYKNNAVVQNIMNDMMKYPEFVEARAKGVSGAADMINFAIEHKNIVMKYATEGVSDGNFMKVAKEVTSSGQVMDTVNDMGLSKYIPKQLVSQISGAMDSMPDSMQQQVGNQNINVGGQNMTVDEARKLQQSGQGRSLLEQRLWNQNNQQGN